MRIAVFADTVYPQINGVSQVLSKYVEYMDDQGIEYALFVPEKRMASDKNNVFHFGGLRFFLYPEVCLALPGYTRISHFLDRFQPDIIHLVTPFSLGLAGMKYARKHGIPMVSSYHTNFDQYLYYYGLPFLQKSVKKYLKWFHSSTQITFCPSRASLLQLSHLGINNPELCPNGVDIEKFSPQYRSALTRQALLAGKEKPILLYVGRIAPEKNLEILMKAVQILNDMEASFQMVVVGDGPSRKKWESMGIDNVVFPGYKTGENLLEIYASADIFVFPSTTETFGIVILEAMSSGLPVVAPRAGGVRDNLIDMYNGLSVRPGDSCDMAYAINRLLQDSNLRAELAANAIDYVLSKTWPEIFAKFFSRLDLLLHTEGVGSLIA